MIRHIFGAILLSLLPILSACAGATNSPSDVSAKIAAMVQNIKAEPSVDVRRKVADEMWKFIWRQDQSIVDDVNSNVIDDVTSLLSDEDDFVRYCAANTLGWFGPRAKAAVPALKAALKRAGPWPGATGGPDLGSEAGIRGALHLITGEPAMQHWE